MKQVFIIPYFHCDVVWRRPPEVQTAIRQRQYDSALRQLRRRPEFRFEFDQAATVREYLENNPKETAYLRRLVKDGRLEVTGGEEAIPDTNMVSGEGLVRNLSLGRLWFAETLGIHPVVANMDDAFGLNAQLPQIFRLLGYRYFRGGRTPGLDPVKSQPGYLWEGLDGSRIFGAPEHGGIPLHSHICNLPLVYAPMERAKFALHELLHRDLPVVCGTYSSEEDLVEDRVVDMILACRPPAGTKLQFALSRDVIAEMERLNPAPLLYRGEFNPSQSGTHITRISLKLAYRRAETTMVVAEAAAACAGLLRQQAWPHQLFTENWRKLSVVQFHDALCGCHTDPVNRKVMGYCRDASRQAEAVIAKALTALPGTPGRTPGVLVFNPMTAPRREPVRMPLAPGKTLRDSQGKTLPVFRCGNEVTALLDLPPLGAVRLQTVTGRIPVPKRVSGKQAAGKAFRFGAYHITPGHRSLKLVHQGLKQTLVDGNFPQLRFRLEDGSLWDERYLGPMYDDLAGKQELTLCEQNEVACRLVWRGEVRGTPGADPLPPVWDSVRDGKAIIYADLKRLAWEKELVFYRELDRIEVILRLDWHGNNTEILAGFPLQLDLKQAVTRYEIPFGALVRKPYYEVPVSSPEAKDAPVQYAGFGGHGAWPAIGWASYEDQSWGMLLANRGTPSHRLMSGMIEVGLIRSPTSKGSTFSVPPSAWENGKHEFRFLLQPFKTPFATADAWFAGRSFNTPPAVQAVKTDFTAAAKELEAGLLRLEAAGVAFSAFKRAENGQGYILRTFETVGCKSRGKLISALPLKQVREADLMEQPGAVVNPAKLTWRPFEIKTLLIEFV